MLFCERVMGKLGVYISTWYVVATRVLPGSVAPLPSPPLRSARGHPRPVCFALFPWQGLIARCIRLLFPGSCHDSRASMRSASRGLLPPAVDATAATGTSFPFPAPSASLTPRIPATNTVASWASLSSALPCVARWWARRHESESCGGGGEERDTDEAVTLAKAMAAAFASAVEIHFSATIEVPPVATSMTAGRAAMDRTPRGRGGAAVIPQHTGGAGHTPRGGNGLVSPHRLHPSTAVGGAQVPMRFVSAVSALSSVPCVQPELVRAVRAVFSHFPHIPIAVLWGAQTAGSKERGRKGLLADEEDGQQKGQGDVGESGNEGEKMAPPPPRQPSAKKRRVSLEAGGFRAAAAGRDGESDRGGEDLPEPRDGCRDETAQGGHEGRRVSSEALLGWRPPVFSGDSAAREAVDVVLAQASAALDFFETGETVEVVLGDRNGSGDAGSTCAGDRPRGDAASGDEDISNKSKRQLRALLRHTAALTCALRMLTPFVDGAARFVVTHDGDSTPEEAGRRLEFGGRWYHYIDETSAPRNVSSRTDKRSGEDLTMQECLNNDENSKGLPNIIGRLVDGFSAAVQAVARHKADEHGQGGNGSSGAIGVASSPHLLSWSPRAVAWLWDMLVTCAGELPVSLLFPALPNSSDAASGGGGDSRGGRQAHLASTVGFAAERVLEVILTPGSAVVNSALLHAQSAPLSATLTSVNNLGTTTAQPRGTRATVSLWTLGLESPHCDDINIYTRGTGVSSAATTTVLGPAAAVAPFPLKCFLLAAASARGWAPRVNNDDGENAPRETGKGGRGNRRLAGGEQGEGLRNKQVRGSGNGGGDGGGGSSSIGGGGGAVASEDDVQPTFSVEEAFLTGLRYQDHSALVTQCAVAALPTLTLCRRCSEDGESPAEGSSSTGRQGEHGGGRVSCNWEKTWLPALLALIDASKNSEAIRLELAAGLLRLATSLDRQHMALNHTAGSSLPSTIHPQLPHSPGQKRFADGAAGPKAFEDLLLLWPSLLQDESAVVRAAAARAALSAASSAPLSRLKATAAHGVRVLRLLIDMLACGDPEVAWVVAGGAGQFVADGGKILRALYAGSGTGGGDEEEMEDEDEDEDTLGAEEEKEREARLRERGVSRFIEAVGTMLQEHGDRLREGRWQSLHEFTALLRALG